MGLTDLAFEANKGVDNPPPPPAPSIFDCDTRSVTCAPRNASVKAICKKKQRRRRHLRALRASAVAHTKPAKECEFVEIKVLQICAMAREWREVEGGRGRWRAGHKWGQAFASLRKKGFVQPMMRPGGGRQPSRSIVFACFASASAAASLTSSA